MSNQFVVCTDSHLANRPPENRIDDYNESILAKIKWIHGYCVRHKVSNIIFAGDLCHTHRTNDELIFRFVDIFSSGSIQVYYLLGNHDIQGGNPNFIQKTNMGLLSMYKWFHLLDVAKMYEFETCYLTGINYSVEKEVCNSFWWWEGNRPQDSNITKEYDLSKKVILVTHAMITNEQMTIKGVAKSISASEVDTNADLLINGHYHIGHKKVVEVMSLQKKCKILNPGSIARMNLSEAIESHGPRIAHIKVQKEFNGADGIFVKFIKIPCKPVEEIFDIDSSNTKKSNKLSKDQFIRSMQAIGDEKMMSDNFRTSLQEVLTNPPKRIRKKVSQEVRDILLNKLMEHS